MQGVEPLPRGLVYGGEEHQVHVGVLVAHRSGGFSATSSRRHVEDIANTNVLTSGILQRATTRGRIMEERGRPRCEKQWNGQGWCSFATSRHSTRKTSGDRDFTRPCSCPTVSSKVCASL